MSREDRDWSVLAFVIGGLLAIVAVPFVVLSITCVNDVHRRNSVTECMKSHTADECAKAFPP